MILPIAALVLALVTYLLHTRLVNKEKTDKARLAVIKEHVKTAAGSSKEALLAEEKQVDQRLSAYQKAKIKAVMLIVVLVLMAVALIVMQQLHSAGII